MENISASILIDGQTVTPPGWMWLLGYAIAGCQWAIIECEKPHIKEQIKDYLKQKELHKLAQEIEEVESQLNQLNSIKQQLLKKKEEMSK